MLPAATESKPPIPVPLASFGPRLLRPARELARLLEGG